MELEMAFRTDRRIRMPNPDGYGKHTGSCGDSVEMFLTVKNDHIQAVSYEIDGCHLNDGYSWILCALAQSL